MVPPIVGYHAWGVLAHRRDQVSDNLSIAIRVRNLSISLDPYFVLLE